MNVSVVAGAASGIGAACAREMAASGASVVMIDTQDLSATAKDITDKGGHCFAVVGDVAKAETWKMAAHVSANAGGATTLFNVAGVSLKEDHALKLPEADWSRVLDVNLNGTWLGIKHIAPQMRQAKNGAIVNMSSATAIVGVQNHAAYSASKGAVLSLTRQMAIELAVDGIRVNAVCPGPVDTPMVQTNTPEAIEAFVEAVPLKRIATAREVAQVMVFLASSACRSVTGVTLPIDGGMTVSL